MSFFDMIRRNPMVAVGASFVLLALLMMTVVVVPETKQALVLNFGKPSRIANAYHDNEDFGRTGAGLLFRVPVFESLVWVDKRVLDFDMERQPVLSSDQRRLEVNAYARYRIVDPVRMFVAAGSERRVSEALKPILGSSLRNELGKRPFSALLSPERDTIMDNIQLALARVAAQYGAEIVDVRIKRADLPEGTPLQSAFERMRSARQQEAKSIEAEGRRQAQVIIGEADATAAKVYAASFGKDPDFYDFYRAMQSYRVTFGTDDDQQRAGSQLILDPNNDYLRQFKGPKR